MCGINGLLALKPQAAEQLEKTIARMNDAIMHRGPDGDGVFVRQGVALGHRRLAILDLSEAGTQPLYNEDRSLVLVFNGEIYNYIELTRELQALGYQFRSHTDSEVIVHAYAQWGEDCVKRFNGMWAFAIWDERRRKLFASRDRLGVKPFYFLQTDSHFIFSSEVVGIRAAQPLREANLGKVHDYLSYGYRSNNGETFLKDVFELNPAHNLVWQDGQVRSYRYWDLPEQGGGPVMSPDDRVDAFAELLRDAVRLRFRSDVPVALLQSGGIDSSVICTVVNDEIAAGRLAYESVSAFTATHPGHAFDESLAVRKLMTTCPHVRSVELTPRGDDLAQDFISYARAMQEPMGSAASYAHWRLMKEVRKQGIKVVLNGQGADEALAGYGYYIRGYRLLDLLLSKPWDVPAEARAMHAGMGWGYGSLMMQTGKAMLGRRAAAQWRAMFVERSGAVLTSAFRRAYARYLPELGMVWRPGNLDRHLRGQLRDYGFNQILHYEDQSSMSQGIEIRSPFVDYRLMEFAFNTPDEEKFSRGITKRILRRAFANRVPDSIINSKTKLGFSTPFADWMQTPSLQLFVRSIVESTSFQSRSIWDAKRLGALLLDPAAARDGFPVWRFLMVALWLTEFEITNA